MNQRAFYSFLVGALLGGFVVTVAKRQPFLEDTCGRGGAMIFGAGGNRDFREPTIAPPSDVVFSTADGKEIVKLSPFGAWVREKRVVDNRDVFDKFLRWYAATGRSWNAGYTMVFAAGRSSCGIPKMDGELRFDDVLTVKGDGSVLLRGVGVVPDEADKAIWQGFTAWLRGATSPLDGGVVTVGSAQPPSSDFFDGPVVDGHPTRIVNVGGQTRARITYNDGHRVTVELSPLDGGTP